MNDTKTGKLSFNYNNDRYGIIDRMDLWADKGLHCGESFDVLINGEWKADRIEMRYPNEWYLVESKLSGSELEGLKVRY